MANNCSDWKRECAGCPAWDDVTAGELIDAAIADPNYAHLKSASRAEIVGMAEQTIERRATSNNRLGAVIGGLTLVATGKCIREELQ